MLPLQGLVKLVPIGLGDIKDPENWNRAVGEFHGKPINLKIG